MSLKGFHIVFIVCSIALALFFAAWALNFYSQGNGFVYFVTGIGSLFTSIALSVYCFVFVRKLKCV